MPRGGSTALRATNKHREPEPEPQVPAQTQSASASSAELQRIPRKLALLEQAREDERNEAELSPPVASAGTLSPPVASASTRSLPLAPAEPGGTPGNEQAALLGTSESSLDTATRRLSTEDRSTPRFSSGPRYAKASSGESNKRRGADSCSSWCEQLLDRLCGKRISSSGGGGDGGGAGDKRDNSDANSAVMYRNDVDGAFHKALVAQPVADARSGAAPGDLFADFEAKAKLFEQLAADASVEASFVEQEEQSRLV